MGVGVFGKAGDIVFGEVGGILRGGRFSEGPVGETAGETGGGGAVINQSDHQVSITANTNRKSLATNNQATYGPDG